MIYPYSGNYGHSNQNCEQQNNFVPTPPSLPILEDTEGFSTNIVDKVSIVI